MTVRQQNPPKNALAIPFVASVSLASRGLTKGWFPKGWFRRMFPRNENRNEGTFAKTTLLETALLSPSDPFWCWQKGGFQKGGFGGCSPGTKTGTRVRSPKPPFYETALLSPSEQGPPSAVNRMNTIHPNLAPPLAGETLRRLFDWLLVAPEADQWVSVGKPL